MSEQVNDAGLLQNVRSRDPQHNPLLHMRDRLFFALFCRVSLLYARSVPRYLQRTLEFLLLFEALMALTMLTFVHVAFVHEPVDCLRHLHDVWPKNGILRVEIIKNASSDYTLNDSYRKLAESSVADIELIDLHEVSTGKTEILEAVDSEDAFTSAEPEEEEKLQPFFITQNLKLFIQPYLQHLKRLTRWMMHEDIYAVEYSLEYGLLRMTPKTRSHLNVTVMLVILDPTKDECFGGWFSQVMLEEFLGYEDVLLSSLHQLATKQNNSGFFRNVLSGDHYRFVEVSVSRVSYVTAAFLMIFFTLSISMLLRYAHQQIFLFIVDLLQVFDRNALITFPLAPLLTAVLALIGVEALMSELFIEASAAFYVILIVWLADQYDVICCHTNISKRHWLRFFYLYHFVFYAYHYRFNGHFSSITLATSWLFIQHSMIYFFHHYELPSIIHQARVQHLILQAQRQSMALQALRQDGTDVLSRSENSAGQQVNYGTMVAFIHEDLSSPASSQDNAADEVGLFNADAGQRSGQQRQTWSIFNLPSFRLSNSLILAQVYVRHPNSTRPHSEQENTVSASHEMANDVNSNSVNVSEVNGDDMENVGSNRAISPSREMPSPRDVEMSADMNIPWMLEEKMDETGESSGEDNPTQTTDADDENKQINMSVTKTTAVDPEASCYQQIGATCRLEEVPGADSSLNLSVLSEQKINSTTLVNDKSSSLVPTDEKHVSHTSPVDEHLVFPTNQNQEMSSFAVNTDNETIDSPIIDDKIRTCPRGEEIEKFEAASE